MSSNRLVSNVAVLALVFCVAACNKRKDEAARPAPIGPSPGAAPSPTAPGAPGATPGSDSPSAGAPSITGRIVLDDARKSNVSPTDTVYLVARRPSENGVRGSLVAVKRFSASSFPIEFTLGPGDMMFKNGEFEGVLMLSARIDKDGDPITRRKGDVFGSLDGVKVGTRNVQIRIDTVQEKDESLAAGAGHGSSP